MQDSRGSRYARAAGEHDRRQLVRAVIAALIGTTIAWYDVVAYGLLANLIIAPLFFPSRDPLVSALAGNLGLVISFAGRPIGGLVFGHIGDRLGRKWSLIATLTLMGVASVLIGALPTYAIIGVFAPVLLLGLRFLVGFGLGGEWTGGVTLVAEWAGVRHRGLWTAFVASGFALATMLALTVIGAAVAIFGPGSMWAWRVPFLLSAVLLGVGLYVRFGILDTPTFSKMLEDRKVERRPILAALSRHPWQIIQVAMLHIGEQAPIVMLGTFLLLYGVVALHMPRADVVNVLLISSVFGVVMPIVFGGLSDVLGRRFLIVLGAGASLVWLAFIFFPYFNTKVFGLQLVAAIGLQVCVAAISGPGAVLVTELFTGRVRYSGVGIGASFGALAAGLTAPLSVWVFATYHNTVYLTHYLVSALILCLLAGLTLPDRRVTDMAAEFETRPEIPPVVTRT